MQRVAVRLALVPGSTRATNEFGCDHLQCRHRIGLAKHCVFYILFFSANSVATVGVRVYGWLRHSRWSHPCPANLVTLTAQKFRHLPFSKEVSHESVAGRPLWIRFTSTPCSCFELYVHCVRGLKRRFA